MPYRRNADLPQAVREALPAEAQDVFRAAFNAAMEQYRDESRAFAVAWAAVRRAGWEKGDDGKWHKAKAEKAARFGIAKVDDEQRLVFGWASVAINADGEPVVDLQDDMIDPAELEKAAYRAMEARFEAGEMHQRTGIGRIVESFVVTPEKLQAMGLAEDVLPIGWWIGVRVTDDDVWQRVKRGEYRAFSIHGMARREEVGDDARTPAGSRD